MIVIVTDTTAYMTRQEYKDLGVICLPMTYSFGDETFAEGHIDAYDSLKSFGGAELTTSQPSLSLILHRFAKLRAGNCEVLCITLSSRLSGTYSNAIVCAKELGGNGIRVVDSLSSAAGLHMIVRRARELADAGAGLDETAGELESFKKSVKTVFSVKDLTPLRKSGRLGFVRRSVGTILNQRPILTLEDGAVVASDIARGSAEQRRKLAECVPWDAGDVTVQCYFPREEVSRLARQLEEKLARPVPVRSIGPVLGIHLGFDVMGVAWVE